MATIHELEARATQAVAEGLDDEDDDGEASIEEVLCEGLELLEECKNVLELMSVLDIRKRITPKKQIEMAQLAEEIEEYLLETDAWTVSDVEEVKE